MTDFLQKDSPIRFPVNGNSWWESLEDKDNGDPADIDGADVDLGPGDDLNNPKIHTFTYEATEVVYTYDHQLNTWTGAISGGANVADPNPGQISATPSFEGGSGTSVDPFVISPATVLNPGGSATSAQTITITGQKTYVPVPFTNLTSDVDIRFDQPEGTTDESGEYSFNLVYNDSPETPLGSGQIYNGSIKVGISSVYFKWDVTQVANLTQLGPAAAPTASPTTVDYAADDKYGTVSGTWADGSHTLTATDMVFSVDGGTLDDSSKSISDGQTFTVGFVNTTVASAAEGDIIDGKIQSTDGTYFSKFTLTKKTTPDSFAIAPALDQPLSTEVSTGNESIKGINAPTTVTAAGSSADQLTSTTVSVNGGSKTASATFNPGDTLQGFGTTGDVVSTSYQATFTVGGVANTWDVTTTDVAPSIAQPSITSPVDGAVDIVPDTITGSAYTPLNGAGATQTSSTWEVCKDGPSSGFQSTNTISEVSDPEVPTVGSVYGGGYFAGQINASGDLYNLIVAPVVSGSLEGQYGGTSPQTIQYRNSANAEANPAVFQDAVYGGAATVAGADSNHSTFNWAVNSATGPNAGTYDATNATGTGIGGFNDWYIPAKNELEILYRNLKPGTNQNVTNSGGNGSAVPPTGNYATNNPIRTTATDFQGSGSQAFAQDEYQSSTEYYNNTGNKYIQRFVDGQQSDVSKTSANLARAVRRATASGIGSSYTLTLSEANTDGFAVGMPVQGSSSGATGIITDIDDTSVTITLTSANIFTTSDKLQGSGTPITGSPFTVSSAPFTQVDVDISAFDVSSTYYTRVQYATTNALAATSQHSEWSEFSTAESFIPERGEIAFGGHYIGIRRDQSDNLDYHYFLIPKANRVGGYYCTNTTNTSGALQTEFNYGGGITWAHHQVEKYPLFNYVTLNPNGPNAGNVDTTNQLGTGVGGYNDWYIPAQDELYWLCHENRDIMNIAGYGANAGGWNKWFSASSWPNSQNRTYEFDNAPGNQIIQNNGSDNQTQSVAVRRQPV